MYNRKLWFSMFEISSYFYYRFAILLENVFSVSFAVQMLLVTTGLSITLLQVSDLQKKI